MHRLVKARSQHFASSPRKTATPLIKKHALYNGKHPPKRRRLGSEAFVISRPVITSDSSDDDISLDETPIVDDDEDDMPKAEGSRSRSNNTRVLPLSSEIGQQTININKSSKTNERKLLSRKSKGKGKAKAEIVNGHGNDVFSNGLNDDDDNENGSSSTSPRKRKRSHMDPDSSADSGSWIEMEEDEEEPEFIAESDQHLIDSAPANALHRLRKAELIRLWKVAGMWNEEDDVGSVTSVDDENDAGMGKKDLVDGLIAARKSFDRLISPLPSSPSRMSPRRKATIESIDVHNHDLRRSTSSSQQHSPNSSSSSGSRPIRGRPVRDADATPKANPRTRSRVRLAETTLIRTAPRRTKDRRKSMTPRRIKKQPGNRGFTPRQTQRSKSKSTPARRLVNGNGTKVVDDADEETEDDEPTPLVNRLRPRGGRASYVKEMSSEVEADDEENEDEHDAETVTVQEEETEEEDEDDSPAPPRNLRSRDKLIDSDISMVNSKKGRALPSRGAKKKAIEALRGGESDTEMEVDEDVVVSNDAGEEEGDETIEEAQNKSQTSPTQPSTPPRRLTRRPSRHSPDQDTADPPESDLTATPDSPSPQPEDDILATPGQIHTTRSGKAFGVMQSRRKRLRQEARDDPDMEVDEDEDEEEDEETDEDESNADDDGLQIDIDLTDATVASLTRLLRDELVQMCESRGIEVGGTKPQLAKALLEWRDEQHQGDDSVNSNPSSSATAKPSSSSTGKGKNKKSKSKSKKIIHAIGSNVHVPGKTTPVLLRDHIHAEDPATPPISDEENKPVASEAELNLDLQELGLEDSIIKPAQLVKLEKIGSGGFKDVFVGKLRGRKVAISEFRGHLSEMDIRELKLLAEFSHPNIVRFRGICIPEDSTHVPCMLVSELCENGDLFDYIRNVPCPSLRRVLNLMLDIARGLEYLHTRKPSIIHRDCKSSNILINRSGQAKVGDFGLARVKNSTRSMIRSLVGTVNWQAPELWHPHPRYDYKVDVFSAGMVYWEMMSGWIGDKKYPWEGHNEHYIYDAVGAKHKRPSVAGLRKHWGDEPVNLMERMWHQDPAERPTMTDVVADLESLIAELR
uniref:TKL protein kinase n=1 Tax=Kwoniella bestiolae CBS 10118 TaxID=1296100 RepID=A0A1B9G757_9TREE|nr:TKL protein kinase [Kwoniella bestiolae CBS 10118]OCF26867.1 TKL protein kinase [Kwoniella bestiolae CBS 10118]